MGVARHAAISFPVGKVDLLTMHPLSFLEFLDNCGENQLAYLIRHGKIDQISRAFNDRLTSLLRTYLVTGGMPAVSTHTWTRMILLRFGAFSMTS